MAVNLTWLSWLLYADAIVSPAGSALLFTAMTSRESYAMAKNGFLPAALGLVHRRSGVPRRAMLANYVIGLLFLLPFQSWHSIVAATSELGLFAYSITAVSEAGFRTAPGTRTAHWIKGTRYLAPASFVIATLILYWATWPELRIALPVLLVGAAVYAVQQVRHGLDRRDLQRGLWLVAYLVAVLIVSAVGSFGGIGWLPAPWDSVTVAVLGLVAFFWGCARHGGTWPSTRPPPRFPPPPRSGNGIAEPGQPVPAPLSPASLSRHR